MKNLDIDWGAADVLTTDIGAVLELLGPINREWPGSEPGTTEYEVRCCAHFPDNNPSLIIIHDPSNPDRSVRYYCRAGCSFEEIMHGAREKAARFAEEEAEIPMDETQAPPKQEQSKKQSASWAETLSHSPMAWWAAHCGVPLSFLRTLPLEEEIGDVSRIKFMYPQTPGRVTGSVYKARIMRVGERQDSDFVWHNAPKPHPPFWPSLPQEMEAVMALAEGEGNVPILRYWGYTQAHCLTDGAKTKLDSEMFDILYARGVRRLLIFYDRDDTGRRNAERLVRLCQDARIIPVPVDLTPLFDPLVGGFKDVRDLRNFWTDPAEARAAIESTIVVAEKKLDRLFPNFEQAYAQAPDDDPWLVEDIVARGCMTLVSSKPGVGKTTVLLAYAAAAREGWPCLDKDVVPHKILLVTEEGTRSLYKKREIFGPMPHVTLHSVDFGDFDSEVWAERVRQIGDVAARCGADVICLDTLLSFALVEDEDRAAKMRPLFKRLRTLTRLGYAVLITAHNRKAQSSGSSIDQIAGSIVIPGEVDIAFALGLSPDGDPAHREMTWVKNRMNNALVSGGPLTITTEDARLIVIEGTDDIRVRERDILNFLADKQWHSRADIATAVSLDDNKLRRPLDRLIRAKRVEKKPKSGPRKHDLFRLVTPMQFDLKVVT